MQPMQPIQPTVAATTCYCGATVYKIIVNVVAYGLCLIGFIIQLGGVGAWQSECEDLTDESRCAKILRHYWWATFFNLFAVVIVGVLTISNLQRKLLVPSGILIAMATVQLMNAAEKFLVFADPESDPVLEAALTRLDGDIHGEEEAEAAAGGYILGCIGNFLLIFILGMESMMPVNDSAQPVPATQQAATQMTPQQYVPQQPPNPYTTAPPKAVP